MAKVEEEKASPGGFEELSEIERLRRDVYRLDMEKFYLLTKMFRTNALLKKAVIRHKKNPK